MLEDAVRLGTLGESLGGNLDNFGEGTVGIHNATSSFYICFVNVFENLKIIESTLLSCG